MDLQEEPEDNIEMSYYDTGHMFCPRIPNLEQFRKKCGEVYNG